MYKKVKANATKIKRKHAPKKPQPILKYFPPLLCARTLFIGAAIAFEYSSGEITVLKSVGTVGGT